MSPLFDDNVKVNRRVFEKSLFFFQVKSLMQSKEELERCIKEQEVSQDVSLPKTDDLVDEVALHLKHISLQYLLIFSQVAALQDENTALRTKIEVLEEESMKKVIFTINNRTKDQEGGVHNQQHKTKTRSKSCRTRGAWSLANG